MPRVAVPPLGPVRTASEAPLPPPCGAAYGLLGGTLALAIAARAVQRLPAAAARAIRAAGAPAALSGTVRRVVLRAAKEADFDVPGIGHRGVNSKPPEGPRGNWMFPEDDGLTEEEVFGDAPPKPPPPRQPEKPATPGFAVWLARRKDAPALLSAWAESSEGDVRELLQQLALEEVPQGWALWALADPESTPGGGGFYIVPPREPQALVFLEPVDETVNNIQHIALNPKDQGPEVRKVVQDWLESLKPKRSVIRQPGELALFGLEVLGGRTGAQVSRGL